MTIHHLLRVNSISNCSLMASIEHLNILKTGRDNWNKWMKENWRELPQIEVRADSVLRRQKVLYVPFLKADLSGLDLTDFKELQGFDFHKVDFSNCNLKGINFKKSYFRKAWFRNADARNTCFDGSNCEEANFINANLSGSSFLSSVLTKSNFGKSTLYRTNFNGADLTNASLKMASLIETKLNRCNLSNCRVYGASIWNAELENSVQDNLSISKHDEFSLTVDSLEIAQFLYLIASNKKFQTVIETLTSKIILILGRFTKERKQILDRIKGELTKKNYVPVIFDFHKPNNKDFIEPVLLIAQLAKFVIADFSDAKLILEEVPAIARSSSTVILPIIERTQDEPLTLRNLYNLRSVSKTFIYNNEEHLISNLIDPIIKQGQNILDELNKLRPA